MQRNGMGAVNPQALTALTGAGGVQTATIVPDLQSINNGKDVRIETDTSLLNANQNLTYDNTFYERILNEIRSTSNNSNQVVIQPTLMGNADTASMCVELQYTATVTLTPAVGSGTIFTCQQLVNQISSDLINNIQEVSTGYYGFYQPEWTMLRNIVRTNIYLGNNASLVQRANMNLGQHYSVLLNDRKYHPDDYMRYAALGLPVANWFPYAASGATDVTQIGSHIPTEYLQANANAMYEILLDSLYPGNTSQTGTSPNRFVTVPLSALNSFFTEKQFLPPSTKMRIELYTNPTNQPIFYFLYPVVTGLTTAATLVTCTMNITNARFNCVSYLMTQTAQEMDNQRWLTSPKVYNYNTYELVQFPTIANQTIYSGLNLAINQQRPTDIKFRIFNPTAQDTFFLGGSTPSGLFNSTNTYAQWYNNSVGNINFYNLRINISGRLNYELRKIDSANTFTRGFQSFSMCMEDAMNMLINRDTWRAPNESVQFNPDVWSDSCNSVTPTMSLSPGDMQSKDYFSTDQGAVSIYVDLEVWQNNPRQALPAGLLIVIYKKLQEQLLLDAAGSTTIVQWPAIKAEGTKVSIPTTFNQN